MKPKMGDAAKDSVTGFRGIVTGVWHSISSPDRYLIEGIDSTGRPIDMWVDEDRVETKKGEKHGS